MSLPAHRAPQPPGQAAPQASRATQSGSTLAHEAQSGTLGESERQCECAPEAPQSATLRLIGTRQGCTQAREFTRLTLDHWALGHCSNDALTVVTELATNAVVHAVPHAPAGEAELTLELTLRPAHLVCAITDQGNCLPAYPHASDPLQEDGRGLRIVDTLSERWGWTWCSPAGKTVWAVLPIQPRA